MMIAALESERIWRHPRHIDVQEREIGAVFADLLQRLFAGLCVASNRTPRQIT
jgi:hypothetical protein